MALARQTSTNASANRPGCATSRGLKNPWHWGSTLDVSQSTTSSGVFRQLQTFPWRKALRLRAFILHVMNLLIFRNGKPSPPKRVGEPVFKPTPPLLALCICSCRSDPHNSGSGGSANNINVCRCSGLNSHCSGRYVIKRFGQTFVGGEGSKRRISRSSSRGDGCSENAKCSRQR